MIAKRSVRARKPRPYPTARAIWLRNTRGSAFSLCERSKAEPEYPRYPRLPVERCPGYERRAGEPDRE